jgi:hypothetical protein
VKRVGGDVYNFYYNFSLLKMAFSADPAHPPQKRHVQSRLFNCLLLLCISPTANGLELATSASFFVA